MDKSDNGVIEQCLTNIRCGKEYRAEFTELVHRYKRFVFAIIMTKVSDYYEAEEIVQEVFIKAFRGLASFKSKAGFASWLGAIARNTCTDYLRRSRPASLPLDDEQLQCRTTPNNIYPAMSQAVKRFCGKLRERI